MTQHCSNMLCRLCGSVDSVTTLTLERMPRWNHRLLRHSELESDHPIDLHIQRCDKCGFVSLPTVLDDSYYSDYVNAPSRSPQMMAFLNAQAKEFVDSFELRGKTILEVGCGDGGFMLALRSAGANVKGVEPSDEQRKIALSQGLSVEAGVLVATHTLADAPFDAVVTRQVFEHVDDMRGFLAAMRAHLRVGGVGLVEVPNLDTLLREDRFFDFIPEHVNYFSSRTLRLVLELAGFTVISIDPVQDSEALRALIRWEGHSSVDGLRRRVDQLRVDITDFVNEHHSRGVRIAVWGAGGKGLSILATTDLKNVDLLVDGDPHKEGRYTPVSHLRVSSPDTLREHSIGAVVIMAPAYRMEILGTLRSKYGFVGPIGVVGPTFEVFNDVLSNHKTGEFE
jgi:SAM-dependent methyltransferase